jgi:hypothetical protein
MQDGGRYTAKSEVNKQAFGDAMKRSLSRPLSKWMSAQRNQADEQCSWLLSLLFCSLLSGLLLLYVHPVLGDSRLTTSGASSSSKLPVCQRSLGSSMDSTSLNPVWSISPSGTPIQSNA